MRQQGIQAALLVLLITAWTSGCAASTLIRGASPDNTAKYTPKNGKFTCFDGSLTIDFSQVRWGDLASLFVSLYTGSALQPGCACGAGE